MPLAKDFRILGTYAQTELSHGSNVSRLETEAVFDEQTDEWVLNTPSITARKWWVGGLAKSCTHCILMARMKIRGKDYGVHPFILQASGKSLFYFDFRYRRPLHSTLDFFKHFQFLGETFRACVREFRCGTCTTIKRCPEFLWCTLVRRSDTKEWITAVCI